MRCETYPRTQLPQEEEEEPFLGLQLSLLRGRLRSKTFFEKKRQENRGSQGFGQERQRAGGPER